MMALADLANQPGAPPVGELVDMERQSRCSRRTFLQSAGMLAAAGLLAGCGGGGNSITLPPAQDNLQPAATSSGQQPSIVIVGAGLAGMNAARVLDNSGLRVHVYEATNRVGGRMFTAADIFGPGIVTELGAEFIDADHTEMQALAAALNLPLLDVKIPSELALADTWFFNGDPLTDTQVVTAFQPLAARIQIDQDKLPDVIDFQTQDPAAIAQDALSISAYFDQIGVSGTIRQILDVAYRTEFGLETSELSSLNFLALINPETHGGQLNIFGASNQQYKIVGGNQRVPQEIAARLRRATVHLQQQLVAIRDGSGGGYVLTFENAGSTVDVKADVVVLTVPFSVLRHVALNVSLPSGKQRAIQQLTYGTNAKLILGFQTRYWRNQGHVGLFFTDLPFQSGWDSSQLQPGTAGSLTCYLGGNGGRGLVNGTPEQRAADFLPGIQKMYPGADSQYTGVATRFHWPTFPFSQGSYSAFGPGQITTMSGEPAVPVGTLYFAGEHCSEAFSGFMEGAARSGRYAAELLLARLNMGAVPVPDNVMRARRARKAVPSAALVGHALA